MRIDLSTPLPRPVLALGAELKNTVCCAAGSAAILSDPLDDLHGVDEFERYVSSVTNLPRSMGVEPACLAHDLHPDYLSTKLARRLDVWPGVPRVGVQHHEAHVASCAASEGVWGECIGLAFDGTGYGTDGTMWGGEFFKGSIAQGFTRVGRLRPMLLPGGPAAIREPWRLALALAFESGDHFTKPAGVDNQAWRVVHALVTQPASNALRSSSIGRLFDAVAALVGLCTHAEREAQAAVALEQAADAHTGTALPPMDVVTGVDGMDELDWRPLVREIIVRLKHRTAVPAIAAAFHDSLAASTVEACGRIGATGSTVVAAGGVFWNKRFVQTLRAQLQDKDMKLVTPTRVPPSDAGLSLGQAVLAAWRPQV